MLLHMHVSEITVAFSWYILGLWHFRIPVCVCVCVMFMPFILIYLIF